MLVLPEINFLHLILPVTLLLLGGWMTPTPSQGPPIPQGGGGMMGYDHDIPWPWPWQGGWGGDPEPGTYIGACLNPATVDKKCNHFHEVNPILLHDHTIHNIYIIFIHICISFLDAYIYICIYKYVHQLFAGFISSPSPLPPMASKTRNLPWQGEEGRAYQGNSPSDGGKVNSGFLRSAYYTPIN